MSWPNFFAPYFSWEGITPPNEGLGGKSHPPILAEPPLQTTWEGPQGPQGMSRGSPGVIGGGQGWSSVSVHMGRHNSPK